MKENIMELFILVTILSEASTKSDDEYDIREKLIMAFLV